ncbi:MAG: zinc ribbon domain-containing protein, partial [Spirochaetaceae bacterium]|nr:zinc ribbon domain-containing protein [Spirochaetaceae bacterium]
MAFCTKCGKQISTGIKFCTSCGAAVAGKVAAAREDMPVIEEKTNVAEEVVNDSVQMQTEIDVQYDADETEEDPYIMERQQAAQIYSKNIFVTLGFLILAVVMGVIALKYPTTTVTTYSASEEINLRETPGADGKII